MSLFTELTAFNQAIVYGFDPEDPIENLFRPPSIED